MIVLLLIIAIALGLFYGILQLDIPGTWKFGLVFVEMLIVSQILIKRYKLPNELGLVLLKSKKGIHLIDSLAMKEKLFNFLADAGLVMSYGLMSIFVLRRKWSPLSLITGLLMVGLVTLFVAPTAFVFLMEVLKIGGTTSKVSAISDPVLGLALIGAVLLSGGLFLLVLGGVVMYGLVVLSAVVKTVFLGMDAISTTSPGGTFLLPGINLPFFEGIIAITIVMIVHEGAHAILARIAKVPLLSSGIVIFGIIPIGAFVEPDEKKLARVEDGKQTRVLVAGSASNLMTSTFFFLLFVALTFTINSLNLIESAYAAPVRFVYITLGLVFALNFIVGAVNLLPLPLFDGYRIIELNVKNKTIVTALTYGTLFFFVLNFLPWLFHG